MPNHSVIPWLRGKVTVLKAGEGQEPRTTWKVGISEVFSMQQLLSFLFSHLFHTNLSQHFLGDWIPSCFNAGVKAAWSSCLTNSPVCLRAPEEQCALTCMRTALVIFPKSALSWWTASSLVRKGKWKCKRNDSIHRANSAQKVLIAL